MKILLTGGSGMLGKNFLEISSEKKNNIISPSRKDLDLLSYSATIEYIKNIKPDLIIHFAGKVGGIEANINEPIDFLIENLDINRNIILAASYCKIKRLINVGSSCIYPKYAKNPLKEEYLLTGKLEPTNEGYALAKIIGIKLCEYINKSKTNYEYKTIIPCNLFGKYDNYDIESSHLIASIINKVHHAKIKNLKEIEIWGSGHAKREFLFASDLADFIIKAIDRFQELPQIINVGTGKDYTINEYYYKISKILGYNGRFINVKNKPEGMKQKLVDTSKLIKFNWSPPTKFIDAIEITYNNYLKINYAKK